MGQPPSGVDLPNRLEIREQLGAGAMGEVFKAFDRQRGQLVVVQVFLTHALDHNALAHWHRVMEILSSLTHPAFIPIYEVAGSERGFWIVRPLVEGQTLADRLRSGGRMDPREAAALVAELAEALHLAHERGLVHGEINPSNILLSDKQPPFKCSQRCCCLIDSHVGSQPFHLELNAKMGNESQETLRHNHLW